MYDYEEACPVSKATSLLCERWTFQIIREMLMGATRFSEFRQYLPKMSPTLLNSRLKLLETNGLVVRKKVAEKKGHEYQLTPSGRALKPIVMELGKWGMEFAWDSMLPEELNASVLVRDFATAIRLEALPSGDFVIQFTVQDEAETHKRFVSIRQGHAQVCDENIQEDVDLYLTASLETFGKIWYGELSALNAREQNALKVVGMGYLEQNLSKWLGISDFSTVNPRRDRTC